MVNWENGRQRSPVLLGSARGLVWLGWGRKEKMRPGSQTSHPKASASTGITIPWSVEGWEGRPWVRGMTGTYLCQKRIPGNDWDIKGHKKGNSGYKNPGPKKLQAGESQKVQARAHTRRVKRTVGFYCAWKGKKKVTKRKMLLGKVLPWDLMPMLTARLYAGNHDLLLAMTSFLTPVPYLNSANRYSPFRNNNPTQAKSKCIIGRTHRGTRRWA